MKVECTVSANWVWRDKFVKNFLGFKTKKHLPSEGPHKGDIVTVEKEYWNKGLKCYEFLEWPDQGGYDSRYFRPVQEQFQEVTFERIKKEKPISVN